MQVRRFVRQADANRCALRLFRRCGVEFFASARGDFAVGGAVWEGIGTLVHRVALGAWCGVLGRCAAHCTSTANALTSWGALSGRGSVRLFIAWSLVPGAALCGDVPLIARRTRTR